MARDAHARRRRSSTLYCSRMSAVTTVRLYHICSMCDTDGAQRAWVVSAVTGEWRVMRNVMQALLVTIVVTHRVGSHEVLNAGTDNEIPSGA